MRSSHGPHNHAHGSGGDSLLPSAGPDTDHQHFPTATAAARAAGSVAVAGVSHADRTDPTDPAATTVSTGITANLSCNVAADFRLMFISETNRHFAVII